MVAVNKAYTQTTDDHFRQFWKVKYAEKFKNECILVAY